MLARGSIANPHFRSLETCGVGCADIHKLTTVKGSGRSEADTVKLIIR